MADDQLKRCRKCQQELPRSAFRPVRENGLRSECRECERLRCLKNSRAKREEYRQRYSQWRRDNPEKHAARNLEWYRQNTPKVLTKQKAYRSRLGDELKNRKRREYVKNADRYRKTATAWRLANPEKRRVAHLRREARKRSLPNNWTLADMKAALAHWSGKCPVCQCELAQIHWDHWIPLICPTCPGTVAENMLPLCSRCNLRKNDSMPEPWLKRMFPTTWEQIRNRIETYLTQCKPCATSTNVLQSSSPP